MYFVCNLIISVITKTYVVHSLERSFDLFTLLLVVVTLLLSNVTCILFVIIKTLNNQYKYDNKNVKTLINMYKNDGRAS